jgi:hypothetical protein
MEYDLVLATGLMKELNSLEVNYPSFRSWAAIAILADTELWTKS